MTYPSTPEFAAINVKSRHANIRSETRSGRTQVRSIGAQRWQFTAKYNDLSRQDFAPVFAFIESTGGGVDSFQIVPPVISDSSGDVSGTVSVSTSEAVGASSVTVTGFTGTIKAGDFVKFTGHSKVYMVTGDVISGGSMGISPSLISAVSDTESVVYSGVTFTMRLSNDVQQYSLSGYDRYQYEVDMIEVI